MDNLKTFLSRQLSSAKRIAILGIGSELRQDDAAGMLALRGIGRSLKKDPKTAKKVRLFLGETAPENLTGEIKKYRPTHLILIDTIEMNEKPGTILVVDPERIADGASFSTHKLPAKVLIDYLAKSFKSTVTIIGIQPKGLDFGKPPSKDVKAAVKEVVRAIRFAVK